MLDHMGVVVTDVARARAFFDAALGPLGISVLMTVPAEQAGGQPVLGYGSGGKPDFWVGGGAPLTGRLHVAFAAPDRRAVDAFYAAAIGAGGRDNGAPGLRPQYHPDYYAAFVLDQDGHNVEAVCHAPESAA